MKRSLKTTLALAFAALVGASAADALADDEEHGEDACGEHDDHDRAYAAVTDDRILPLAKILEDLTPQFGSALIEIEFECSDGAYVYVFEIRTPQGRIVEFKVDAVTGDIIRDGD